MARSVKRNAGVSKPVYLQAATESANAVGEVLVAHYGRSDAVVQVMEMVQAAVDRAIKQLLTGAAPAQNAQPFVDGAPNQYAFEARTSIETPEGNMKIPEELQEVPDPNKPLKIKGGLILPGESNARPESGRSDGPVSSEWVL